MTNRSPRRVRIERGLYRQPNGKYAACLMIDGRASFRTLDATTLAEARAQRELLRVAGQRHELVASPQLTFAEVARRWLDEFEAKVAAGERRQRTLELYRSHLGRHLLPELGRSRIQLITPDQIAMLIGRLEAKGLAPWTIRGVLIPLGCVFGFALRRGLATRNPLRRLERSERPRVCRSNQRVLTQSEIARLLAVSSPRYRPLLATAIYTGMRFSEVLALSWGDIDPSAGVIHVRHALARGRAGVPPHRTAPKTPASVREIPLVPQLTAVLQRHKLTTPFTADADYVFATRGERSLLHRNAARDAFRRTVKQAGLEADGRRIRFHDLRHTFASHLIIDVRLDPAQVSHILGHARTSFTLDTYTHLFAQATHTDSVRDRLTRSEFAMLLERAAEPKLRPRRARGLASRPGRARIPSRTASQARRRAAAASARKCCAGRSRSARSPSNSCPSGWRAPPG
jgi:integrase